MNSTQKYFTADELQQIDEADDLKIAPLRSDGVTLGTPTWIWEVIVDGNLYVRAYNGTASRWHQSAIKMKSGRIYAAGLVKEVNFEQENDEDIKKQIDEAYQQKYSKSTYMAHMTGGKAKAATIKITPL